MIETLENGSTSLLQSYKLASSFANPILLNKIKPHGHQS
jgi:hypothetical protein